MTDYSVEGFCYTCDKQVKTTRNSPVRCAICHGYFIVAFDIPPVNILNISRILSIEGIVRDLSILSPATATIQEPPIVANSAVLASIPTITQAASASEGFCYTCDKQVSINKSPISCAICGGNFIEIFEIPTDNSPIVRGSIDVAAVRLPDTHILPATVRLGLPATSVSEFDSSGSIAAAASSAFLTSGRNNNIQISSTSAGVSGIAAPDCVVVATTKRNALTHLVLEASEPKSKMARKEEENNVEDICSICFDEWNNSGPHRLVSLKCGHLFGESCITKWLRSTHKCALCNAANRLPDIRRIFARTVTSRNTDAYDFMHKQNIELQKKYDDLLKNSAQAGSSVFSVSQLGPQPVGFTFTETMPESFMRPKHGTQ